MKWELSLARLTLPFQIMKAKVDATAFEYASRDYYDVVARAELLMSARSQVTKLYVFAAFKNNTPARLWLGPLNCAVLGIGGCAATTLILRLRRSLSWNLRGKYFAAERLVTA